MHNSRESLAWAFGGNGGLDFLVGIFSAQDKSKFQFHTFPGSLGLFFRPPNFQRIVFVPTLETREEKTIASSPLWKEITSRVKSKRYIFQVHDVMMSFDKWSDFTSQILVRPRDQSKYPIPLLRVNKKDKLPTFNQAIYSGPVTLCITDLRGPPGLGPVSYFRGGSLWVNTDSWPLRTSRYILRVSNTPRSLI